MCLLLIIFTKPGDTKIGLLPRYVIDTCFISYTNHLILQIFEIEQRNVDQRFEIAGGN